jgi:hypothetical protein
MDAQLPWLHHRYLPWDKAQPAAAITAPAAGGPAMIRLPGEIAGRTERARGGRSLREYRRRPAAAGGPNVNLGRRLKQLERRRRDMPCGVCKGYGGRRILSQWPGEPVDLATATACRSCGRCPPPEQVKIIDLSGVLELGLNPYELLVAKCRANVAISSADIEQLKVLEKEYAAVSSLKMSVV